MQGEREREREGSYAKAARIEFEGTREGFAVVFKVC